MQNGGINSHLHNTIKIIMKFHSDIIDGANKELANLLHDLNHAVQKRSEPEAIASINKALVEHHSAATLAIFVLFGSLRNQETKCIFEYEKILDIITEYASKECSDDLRARAECYMEELEQGRPSCH